MSASDRWLIATEIPKECKAAFVAMMKARGESTAGYLLGALQMRLEVDGDQWLAERVKAKRVKMYSPTARPMKPITAEAYRKYNRV